LESGGYVGKEEALVVDPGCELYAEELVVAFKGCDWWRL